jgi:hypothetical protein
MPAGPYQDALRELEELERSISRERTRLQARIDFVRAGTGAPDAAVSEQLRILEEREREVSKRRLALHRQIDVARVREAS